MGTSNFARGNASKTFAVLMNEEVNYKQCDICFHRHHEYDHNLAELTTCENECENPTFTDDTEYRTAEDWDRDDLLSNLREQAEEKVKGTAYTYDEESGSDNDRNYCASYIFSLRTSKSFGDIEVEIRVMAKLVGAYYEGASLDYDTAIYNGSEWCDIEDGHYTVTEEDILDDLFEIGYSSYTSEMNKGMRLIQCKNAEKWAVAEVSKLQVLTEEVFTQVSMPLNVVATFSNGETIYSKA